MQVGILVLIGLPGCGKTTLSRTLKQKFQNLTYHPYNFIHVCYDELIPFSRLTWHDENHAWKEARLEVLKKIELLVSTLLSNDKQKCPTELQDQIVEVNPLLDTVIIIDDNMYYRSMRYQLYKIALKEKISFCQVFFECELANSINTNTVREKEYQLPLDIISKIHEKLEPPKLNAGWEKHSITVEAFTKEDLLLAKVFELLNISFKHKEEQKNEEKLIQLRKQSVLQCLTSVCHQIDITLRKLIGAKIQQYLRTNKSDKSELRIYSSHLNLRKAKLLSDLKTGDLQLPNYILEEMIGNVEKVKLTEYLENWLKL